MHAHDPSTRPARELAGPLLLVLALTLVGSLAAAATLHGPQGHAAAATAPTVDCDAPADQAAPLLGGTVCLPPTPTTAGPTTTTTAPTPPPTVAPATVPAPAPAPPPPPRPRTAAPAATFVAPPSPPPPPPSPSAEPVLDTSAEARLRSLLTQRRQAIGQPDLGSDGTLSACARRWSYRMALQGRIDHSGTGGEDCATLVWSVCACSSAAENVGQATTADRVWAQWVGSAGHAANIDHAGGGIVGIGVYRHNGSVWATMVFGYR